MTVHALVLPRSLTRMILALALLVALAPSAARAEPLDALAWMAGSWGGTQNGVQAEEHWTSPAGGLMLSVHRDLKGGRAASFEFLRIVARGDSITYIALPRGRGETLFPINEMSAKRVVFENPEHDFPQRIIYWQEKPGELRARTEGTINGKPESEEWTWKKGRLGR